MVVRERAARWALSLALLGAVACNSDDDIGGESHFACVEDTDCQSHLETPWCVDGTCQASPGEGGTSEGDAGDAGADDVVDAGADATSSLEDGAMARQWPLVPPPPDTPSPAAVDDCVFEPDSGFAVLAEGEIAALAVTDSHVVYGEILGHTCVLSRCSQHYAIRRLPRCGGEAESIEEGDTEAGLPPLLAVGDLAYQLRNDGIVRYGATTESILGSCLEGLSGNAAALYAIDHCNLNLVRVRHDSTALEVVVSGLVRDTATYPRYATAAGTSVVYFVDGDGIGWWSLDEQRGGRLHATPDRIVQLGVGQNDLIALVSPDVFSASVRRVPLDGSAPETLVASVAPQSIVVEPTQTYYSGIGINVARNDGSAEPSMPIQRNTSVFDVYGDRIYWAQDAMLLTGKTERPLVAGTPETLVPGGQTVIGGSSNESFRNVAVSSAGEPVVLAVIQGDSDFGAGPIVADRSSSLVVAKLSTNLETTWTTLVAPTSIPAPAPLEPGCLAVMPGGEVAITTRTDPAYGMPAALVRISAAGSVTAERSAAEGYFWDVCAAAPNGDLFVVNEPDPLAPSRVTTTALDVLRIDVANADVWSAQIGQIDVAEQFTVRDMAADPQGNGAVLAAAFTGDVDLGDGLRSSNGEPSSLVARIDDAGALSWSASVRGGDLSRIEMMADGGVAALGTSRRFVDVGAGEVWVEYPGEEYGLVVRYDVTGVVSWLRFLRGHVDDLAIGSGDSLLIGSSYGPTELLASALVTSSSGWIAELDPGGTPIRALAFSESLEYSPIRIAAAGGVFTFSRTVSGMGGDPNTDGVVTSWP